jgi:hypothetical protein
LSLCLELFAGHSFLCLIWFMSDMRNWSVFIRELRMELLNSLDTIDGEKADFSKILYDSLFSKYLPNESNFSRIHLSNFKSQKFQHFKINWKKPKKENFDKSFWTLTNEFKINQKQFKKLSQLTKIFVSMYKNKLFAKNLINNAKNIQFLNFFSVPKSPIYRAFIV